MSEAYGQLLAAVDQTRRAWRARRALEGATLTLAAAAGALLVAGLIDLAVDARGAGRWVLAAGVWGAALATAWGFWVRPLRVRHSGDYYAALLEQKLGLGNRLINALQLGRASEGAAPRLREAIVADGARGVDDLDPGPAVRSAALRRFAIGLGVAVGALALFAGLGGPGARTALARVMMPGASIPPFTWTGLEVTVDPARARLLEGEAVTVEAVTRGRLAERATLHVVRRGEEGGTDRRRISMKPAGAGRFTHTLDGLVGSHRLHVEAGDARSAAVSITVDPRPRITAAEVTYDYPAYAGRSAEPNDAMSARIEALRGTGVTLELTTNRPMAGLTLGGASGTGEAAGEALRARPVGQTTAEGHATRWRVAWTLGGRG